MNIEERYGRLRIAFEDEIEAHQQTRAAAVRMFAALKADPTAIERLEQTPSGWTLKPEPARNETET